MGIAADDQPRIALIWTENHGLRSLREFLEEHGLAETLVNWDLLAAHAISDDGLVIAGFGLNPTGRKEGFVANLRPAVTLESTPSLSIPFAPNHTAEIDHTSRRITIPATNNNLFLRLTGPSALRIMQPRLQAGRLVFSYENAAP